MKTEIAVLAGGCFWGVEELLRKTPGVIDTEVGYCGGDPNKVTYNEVKKGSTGHAEAVQIEFDPSVLPYEGLLDIFFRLHDPTQLNRQENDIGTQYRSAIFFQSEEQKEKALAVKKKVDESGRWQRPVVTAVVPASPFYSAESYHQDYLQKNPDGYNCHWLRP